MVLHDEQKHLNFCEVRNTLSQTKHVWICIVLQNRMKGGVQYDKESD